MTEKALGMKSSPGLRDSSRPTWRLKGRKVLEAARHGNRVEGRPNEYLSTAA